MEVVIWKVPQRTSVEQRPHPEPTPFQVSDYNRCWFDNRYVSEGVTEHVDERHVHSVIEPRGVVATSLSTTFLSDWRGTRRNAVLSEAR